MVRTELQKRRANWAWLVAAMLAVALPVAGQGFMGKKIRSSVWLEQLVLHVIFGFSLWWALGIV